MVCIPYANDILQGYSNTLNELSLAEINASEISGETIKYIKDMDCEEHDGKVKYVTELSILSKINKEINPHLGKLPDPMELAGEIIDKLGILEYLPHQTQFKIKAPVRKTAKVKQ